MKQLSNELLNDIIEQTCTIQAIPAPTFHENKRAAFFFQQFTLRKLIDVQMDAAGNVLGRIPGYKSARPLVVSAHMDTVHPEGISLDIQKTTDRIIGPGIGDNALGLASILGLVQWLQASNTKLPGDLWLVANVAEEGLGDLRGMQEVVKRFGDTPLAYLVIEGLGIGRILHRGLGVERYRISTHTAGGHSWVDFGTPSAIHELCKIVSRLTTLSVPRRPCTSWNVGVIHGGTSVNTIASEAWLELDLRSEEKSALGNLVAEVHAIVQAAQNEDIQVKIEQIGKRMAGEIPANHPLVLLAQNALQELHIESRLDIASTDANWPLGQGLPAICIGITLGNHAHTKEEYILTNPITQGMQQLCAIVTRAWSVLS